MFKKPICRVHKRNTYFYFFVEINNSLPHFVDFFPIATLLLTKKIVVPMQCGIKTQSNYSRISDFQNLTHGSHYYLCTVL